jgi:hypothetical protein
MYCLVAVAPSAVDHSLLCFDLESEQWIKTIDSPRKVSGGGDGLWKLTWILPIVELNGALCMVQKETDMTGNSCIHIWLLTDFDNETWNKEYTIPMPSNTSDYMPLWMAGDSGKLIFYNYVGWAENYALQVYDPHTGTCTMLRLLDKQMDIIGVCSLHLDNFVSPKI